jgi:hypothetical protein
MDFDGDSFPVRIVAKKGYSRLEKHPGRKKRRTSVEISSEAVLGSSRVRRLAMM